MTEGPVELGGWLVGGARRGRGFLEAECSFFTSQKAHVSAAVVNGWTEGGKSQRLGKHYCMLVSFLTWTEEEEQDFCS